MKKKKQEVVVVEEHHYLTCQECGKSDETVDELVCGYYAELHDEERWETICAACEHEHIMDI